MPLGKSSLTRPPTQSHTQSLCLFVRLPLTDGHRHSHTYPLFVSPAVAVLQFPPRQLHNITHTLLTKTETREEGGERARVWRGGSLKRARQKKRASTEKDRERERAPTERRARASEFLNTNRLCLERLRVLLSGARFSACVLVSHK